ncbi:hypothetical protein [Aurantimonas sp. HBX-1]|uniref:hypothetical protein n=1 Tax=Aurantimonas sp. HBX-1 TaxID=2906072 RepID=UPI001F26882F|nr:hypothetical protein [Aurantimonas sp. HBX-1]UIJ72431.1 hypothetical protein LXB15_01835 [Aurantimonas sp. HBX-1]
MRDKAYSDAIEEASLQISSYGIGHALKELGRSERALAAFYFAKISDTFVPVKILAQYAGLLYARNTGVAFKRLRGGYRNFNSSGRALEEYGISIYRENRKTGDKYPVILLNPDPEDINPPDIMETIKILQNYDQDSIKKIITNSSLATRFDRSAALRALALIRAGGVCELCDSKAPSRV